MLKALLLSVGCCFMLTSSPSAHTYSDQEGRAAWNDLKKNPLTENSFRSVCDLMQDIGQTNLNLSYEILAEYVPRVKVTGNRRWMHVLLMGWAKAKYSMNFFEEGELLYRQARENAGPGSQYYREAVVATVLMYLEWGKADSLQKYLDIGERDCRAAVDKENLSFIFTFKAMSRMADTAAMRTYLEQAMTLGEGVANKNALFTARYNYAAIYCQYSPQQQVSIFEGLLELAKDPSLNHKPRLYERTDFSFRNPAPSVYYELMQVNLLLLDYGNAWKFMELFYDSTVKPNPHSVNAPYFLAEMSIVKAYQGDYGQSKIFLDTSLALFHLPEEKIPYISYFIAAGMNAEHAGQLDIALKDYGMALKKGNTEGLYLIPPELYYAHALMLNHQLDKAAQILAAFKPLIKTRAYSAVGYYYYKYETELLKARGDHAGYDSALETFYAVKDSLGNLSHYRAVQEIETKIRLRDKEQQILRLGRESADRLERIRKDRINFLLLSGLSALVIFLLMAYGRNFYLRRERQHRMDVMQGAMDAEETERRKIADELHDEVGAMLSLATLHISSTLENGRQTEQADHKLQKTLEVLGSVSGTIRSLSHRLTPLVIEKYGFRKAIEDLTYTVNLSEKLTLETVLVGFDGSRFYPAPFLQDIYRILQELIHNIIKHAQATTAHLDIVEHAGLLSIMVEDNGIGLEVTTLKDATGKGLHTIRSRIAYLKGSMEISPQTGGGTLIVMEIPTPYPKS